MKRTIFALVGAVMFAGSAMAGPQYVDKTGYAVSGYDVISYWDQKQTPVGKKQVKAVPGKASITTEYNGAKWAFASEANRDKFKANPAKYAPVFDGHCAYGVAVGGKVPGNPHLWRIVDNKLYLNITKVVVGFWEKDIPGFIKTGNKNWSKKLKVKPAAKRKVPSFDTAMAPL
ncbi:MAG: YHS domain-containing protein [Hyphomicrobiaceae bacterium]|jgi:YHS domain-containing protein